MTYKNYIFNVFGIILFSTISTFAYAERDQKPGIVKRRYIHSCPSGTEQIGDGPPKSSIVFCRQILQSGYRMEGDYTTFYKNGNKRTEGSYRLGKKEGSWKTYSKYGDIIESREYKNGIAKRKEPQNISPNERTIIKKDDKKAFNQDREVLNQLRISKSKNFKTKSSTGKHYVYGISGR